MKSQVLMVRKPVQSCVRDAAHTDLESSPVRNLSRDPGTDGLFDLRWSTELHIHRRIVALDSRSYLRLVDHRRAVEIRNALVDLGDHHTSRLDCRLGKVSGNIVAAIAVLVRKRAVYAGNVDRDLSPADKLRKIAQEARDQAPIALGHILALVPAQEQAVHDERFLIFRLAESRNSLGHVETGNYLDITQTLMMPGKSLL